MAMLFLFLMVIAFMLVGVPIAISLGLSSVIFLLMHSDASLASVAQTLFNAFAGHYTLLAIPFFILASSFMSIGGVAKRIIRFAIAMVGWFRGGLAMASVVACMMFAALSGSSPATVVAIGSIVIAGMIKNGYTKEFAAGVICNAGTSGYLDSTIYRYGGLRCGDGCICRSYVLRWRDSWPVGGCDVDDSYLHCSTY